MRGLGALALGALALRVLLVHQQSAYMDEASFILTGRTLLEKQAVYAGALTWTYGSYLWPLLAGVADMVGGLALVRTLTAAFGAVMCLATTLAAVQLVPRSWPEPRRWTAVLLAGSIVAVLPTPIAIGRFGTYDAPAGAAFMAGIAVLVGAVRGGRGTHLLAAAGLLFIAFLAKYLVAIYFPFVCLYLLLSPRSRAVLRRNLVWFVLPLSVACALYFLAFRDELLTLLLFSTGYTDLTSPEPVRQYVLDQPELWALFGLALLGWQRATRAGRLVALSGTGIMLGFHALARADFDFWKHSIYPIFFLAPLAGLALAPLAERLAVAAWRRDCRGMPAWRPVGLALTTGGLFLVVTAAGLVQSSRLVTFYPNLTPSLEALALHADQATTVLADDSAIRYYLYPKIPTERVTDPFFVDYQGRGGIDGYQNAIADRYFDVIVLTGGISPGGRRLKEELGGLIAHYYRPVYARAEPDGRAVELYRPLQGEVEPFVSAGPNWRVVQYFDADLGGWGGQPEGGELQPGLRVIESEEQTWYGHPSLKFTPDEQVPAVAVKETGQVRAITLQLYVVGAEGGPSVVPVAMFGFDVRWRWRDDGFQRVVPVGQWTELTWRLPEPGVYHQLGLKFPAKVAAAYLGKVEIEPWLIG